MGLITMKTAFRHRVRQGLTLSALALLATTACTNTVQYGENTRSETIRTEIGTSDLLVSGQQMINKLLNYDAVQRISQNSRLRLAYAPLIDQTDENLNLNPLNSSIVQHLEGSGRFLLADLNKVKDTLAAMEPELDFRAITIATAPEFAARVEADLLLYGTITNVVRTKSNSKEVYYRMALALWDTKNERVIWQDDSEHLKSRKKIVFGL